MISSAIIDDIYTVAFTDVVTVGDIYEYIHEFNELHNSPQHLKVLYDFTDVDLMISLDDIPTIAKEEGKATSQLLSLKTAFVVKDPKVTAYVMLFQWARPAEHVIRREFSSIDVALKWLKSSDE